MKTLICLLSGQPVPNLMSCKVLRPERIVLVETSKMHKKSVAKNFKKALKKMSIDVVPQIVNVHEGDDNNFPNLKKFFDTELLQAFPKDQIFLNLTGGTKPMSIALYETFKNHPNAEFYYFDVDYPCDIIDFLKYESHQVGQIPLAAFLAGYGYKAHYFPEAEKKALERKEMTMLLAQKCNTKKFRIWATGKREWINKAMNTSSSILTQGILVPRHRDIATLIANQFNLQQNSDGSLVGTLTGIDVKYLDGGWLEEFVWLTMNKFKDNYNLKDLHLGLEMKSFDSGTKNELDVSFMLNNTFYVLECKTGLQKEMLDNQYKLFAVSKQLQAIGIKTFLISNSKTITEEKVQKRAQLHSTTLINADQIRQMALDPEKELEKLFNPQKK